MGKRREPTEAELIAEQRKVIKDALDEGKTEIDLRTESMDVLRELCSVKTLKKLTLHLGKLKTLPKEIGQLTGLEHLHIDNNELTSLPEEIGALERLEIFYAYHNKLTSLPESFGDLVNLKKLVLWQNELTKLPKSFGKLKRANEIELKWNKLASLPDEIAGLEALEEFDLRSNALTDLPKDLSGMKKLRRLGLETNKLKTFPKGLLTLPALVELDLGENQLSALPDDIDRIATLREMNLEGNAITKLPKALFSLPMTSIKLAENKLTAIPRELVDMAKLAELELRGNPIKDVPEELLGKSKGEIFKHLGWWKPKVITGDLPEPAARKAILDQYKVRFEKFVREAKSGYRSRDKFPIVLAFIRGDTNEVPPSVLEDSENLSCVLEAFAPYAEWTFIERRALAFMAQDAWRYKNPGYDYFRGFDKPVFRWLNKQMTDEPAGSTLFGDVAKELIAHGVSEEELVAGALRELHESVLREDDKSPTSFGRFLLEVAPRYAELFGAQTRDAIKEALIGLLIRHARPLFSKLGDKLLAIRPDEDGDIHIPYEAIEQAAQVEPARYEKLLLEGIEKTTCDPCRAESARVLAAYYPKHREQALAVTKRTLAKISERKNKEENYSFYWSTGEHWSDATAQYVDWALQTFGGEVEPDVKKLVEDTKVFGLDVAEVLAKRLGQRAIDMLGEGLKMHVDGDEIAPHFRRMFALLAPLDWSKFQDLAWGLARSEFRKVRETACFAVARFDPKVVVPKAKELLASKKGHEREGGVLVLSLVDDPEAKKILRGLLDTEKTDDARDIIVRAVYRSDKSCDRAELDARVKSAKARGKLDKPIAKWLDEKKLPKLSFAKSKSPVDADTLRFFFQRQTRQTEIAIDPEVRAPLALVDRAKAGEFAAKLLALVLKNGGAAAKNRFALALVGALGDDAVVPQLEKLAVEDRNENAVRTLGMVGSMAAARALDRVMKVYRVKYPNVREAAQEAFDTIAEGMGMTPFELADTMIPDFGMVKGRLAIAGTKPELFAGISGEQKVALFDKTGAPVKPPKTLGPKPKAALKQLGEDLRAASRQLGSNLEYYLIVRRRWARAAFDAFFEGKPLAASFALGFVFATYENGKPKVPFRIDEARRRLDEAGKPVTLAANAEIGFLHPLEISPELRARWIAVMKAAGATPAFPQLERPTFAVLEDERVRAKCFRFEDQERERHVQSARGAARLAARVRRRFGRRLGLSQDVPARPSRSVHRHRRAQRAEHDLRHRGHAEGSLLRAPGRRRHRRVHLRRAARRNRRAPHQARRRSTHRLLRSDRRHHDDHETEGSRRLTTERDLEERARRLEGETLAQVRYQKATSLGDDVHAVAHLVWLDFESGLRVAVGSSDELGVHHGHAISVRERRVVDTAYGPVEDVSASPPIAPLVGKRIMRATIVWDDVKSHLRSSLGIGVAIHADHLRRSDFPQSLVLDWGGDKR